MILSTPYIPLNVEKEEEAIEPLPKLSYTLAAGLDMPVGYVILLMLEMIPLYIALYLLLERIPGYEYPEIYSLEWSILVVIIQTGYLSTVRRTRGFALNLAAHAAKEVENLPARRRIFANHLKALERLGDEMSGGHFEDSVALELKRARSDIDSSISFQHIVSSIDKKVMEDVISAAIDDERKPFVNYYYTARSLLETEKLRASDIRDYIISLYLSVPTEVLKRVESSGKPMSRIEHIERHIELTRLLLWIVLAVTAITVTVILDIDLPVP